MRLWIENFRTELVFCDVPSYMKPRGSEIFEFGIKANSLRRNSWFLKFFDLVRNKKSRFWKNPIYKLILLQNSGCFFCCFSEMHLNKGYIFQCLLWYLFRTINEFINYSPLILPHLRRGDIFLAILRKLLLPRLLKPPKKSQCGQKYLKLKMSWIFTVSIWLHYTETLERFFWII